MRIVTKMSLLSSTSTQKKSSMRIYFPTSISSLSSTLAKSLSPIRTAPSTRVSSKIMRIEGKRASSLKWFKSIRRNWWEGIMREWTLRRLRWNILKISPISPICQPSPRLKISQCSQMNNQICSSPMSLVWTSRWTKIPAYSWWALYLIDKNRKSSKEK